MRDNRWTWLGLFGLALAALIYVLHSRYPGVLGQEDAQMRLVYAVALLSFVGGSFVLGWRGSAGLALKQALVWITIALGLIIGYGYRDAFYSLGTQVRSELAPASPQQTGPGTVTLTSTRNGHFLADALINGTHVRLLVDTGASDVALTMEDARRLGFKPQELSYTVPYQTANGLAFAARVTLDEIKLGPITQRNVRASVMSQGLDQSLLGMSFLGQLRSLEVQGSRLILKQ